MRVVVPVNLVVVPPFRVHEQLVLIVPVKLKVPPVPVFKTGLFVEKVIPAEAVSVPVVMVMEHFLLVAAAFRVISPPTESVPDPMVIEVVILLVLGAVQERVLERFSVPVVMFMLVVFAVLALMLMLAALTVVDTVILWPAAIVMVSPATGPPATLQLLVDVHVVEVVQSPLCAEVQAFAAAS